MKSTTMKTPAQLNLCILALAFFLLSSIADAAPQNCTGDYDNVEIPNKNGDPPNPPRPFPVGDDEGECACLAYQYMITVGPSDCNSCKFRATFTWQNCREFKKTPCYDVSIPSNASNTYTRVHGAPACCGPATLPFNADPAVIRGSFYEYVGMKDFNTRSGMSTPCNNQPGRFMLSAPCPADQTGGNVPVCDEPAPGWSGLLLSFSTMCEPCP